MADKKQYRVVEGMHIDGVFYPSGSQIELYPEQAAAPAVRKNLLGDFPPAAPADLNGLQKLVVEQQELIAMQREKIEDLTEQNAVFHKGLGEAAERIRELEGKKGKKK
jgi:hypothetical protein